MIRVLVGENTFEIEQFIKAQEAQFEGTVTRLIGEELSEEQFISLLTSLDLFSEKKLIIIRQLSDQKTIWNQMASWLGRVSDSVELILLEKALDKRTALYKKLKEQAEIKEFIAWGKRDYLEASRWLENQAKQLSLKLDKKIVQQILTVVGFDQWQLYNFLQQLQFVDKITEATISDLAPKDKSDNIFDLLERALAGKAQQVQQMLASLKLTEDVYALSNILAGQIQQLVVVAVARPGDRLAQDFKVHPFVVEKFQILARQQSLKKLTRVVAILVENDRKLKTSQLDPWLVLEEALLKIVRLS